VDYFALPDIYRNESKGSLAWATKDENGFVDEHIAFFELTLPALTTVLRTHTNDLVLLTLTHRTQELVEANQKLMRAMDQLAIQSQKQREHFACMSHEIRTLLKIVSLEFRLYYWTRPQTLCPEVTESMQMVNTSADLLAAVVTQVLDYSKMESGVFQVDVRPTNLQDTIDMVVHTTLGKKKNDQECCSYRTVLWIPSARNRQDGWKALAADPLQSPWKRLQTLERGRHGRP
jgi:signal transduction histidine kinase